MTAATLRSLTAKDLAQMARERGVAGWHRFAPRFERPPRIGFLVAREPSGK
jgi:hypothetical protein